MSVFRVSFAMAAVNAAAVPGEQPRTVEEVMAEQAQIQAEQAQIQADNAAAVLREMEVMREAMKDLTEQAEVSKKQARKVVLDKAVASVKQASSRRLVRYTDFG